MFAQWKGKVSGAAEWRAPQSLNECVVKPSLSPWHGNTVTVLIKLRYWVDCLPPREYVSVPSCFYQMVGIQICGLQPVPSEEINGWESIRGLQMLVLTICLTGCQAVFLPNSTQISPWWIISSPCNERWLNYMKPFVFNSRCGRSNCKALYWWSMLWFSCYKNYACAEDTGHPVPK